MPELTMSDATELIVNQALNRIRFRFEFPPDSLDRLDYHTTPHTLGVIRRTMTIYKRVHEGTPAHSSLLPMQHALCLARIGSACHDTVQRWTRSTPDLPCLRRRHIGQNEVDSGHEAVQEMRSFTCFTPEDCALVQEGIEVTIPTFDAKQGTVFQAVLEKDINPIARAIAMADLSAAGMDGGDDHLHTTDSLFREDHIGYENPSSPESKELLANMIRDWSASQVRFIQGRLKRFPDELALFPAASQAGIAALFTTWEESLWAASKMAELRNEMTHIAVIRSAGYRI